MRSRHRSSFCVTVFAVALSTTAAWSSSSPRQAVAEASVIQNPTEVAAIRVEESARRDYLARATLWRDRTTPTPEQMLEGPPGRFHLDFEAASRPEGFPCTFELAGHALGGKTKKFVCRTADGETLRVKYYEGAGGNREVFASVASTRLLWALGFHADAVFPVTVSCLECPADPWTGTGPKSTRVFVGTVEPHFEGTLILSDRDLDQGWTYQELDDAIRALPPGGLRGRQRMHFDALSLVGVLIQHGDRKPSQQRLTCRGSIDFGAGDVHRVSSPGESNFGVPVLFEQAGQRSCQESVVTIQDAGATLGGAGFLTTHVGSKMNLSEWSEHAVFRDAPFRYQNPRDIQCIGNLVVSHTAKGGEGMPPISEEGRLFLLQQLQRLNREHLRALFTAARVEMLGDENRFEHPETGESFVGADAWVEAFEMKVREIEETRCRTF